MLLLLYLAFIVLWIITDFAFEIVVLETALRLCYQFTRYQGYRENYTVATATQYGTSQYTMTVQWSCMHTGHFSWTMSSHWERSELVLKHHRFRTSDCLLKQSPQHGPSYYNNAVIPSATVNVIDERHAHAPLFAAHLCLIIVFHWWLSSTGQVKISLTKFSW